MFPALFSLNMLLGTQGGQAYSEDEIENMMLQAGIENIQRTSYVGPMTSGIMVGTHSLNGKKMMPQPIVYQNNHRYAARAVLFLLIFTVMTCMVSNAFSHTLSPPEPHFGTNGTALTTQEERKPIEQQWGSGDEEKEQTILRIAMHHHMPPLTFTDRANRPGRIICGYFGGYGPKKPGTK